MRRFLLLKGSANEPIFVSSEDDSEIEITIIELEGNKSRVIICANQAVSVVRKSLVNQDLNARTLIDQLNSPPLSDI